MQKRIHKLLFYTLLLSVYAGFFSVESFFNFEGQSEVRTTPTHSSYFQKSPTTPLQSAHKHLVRLNKRYHQEDISLSPVISPETPFAYVVPGMTSLYRDCPLSSGPAIHRSLRGPPSPMALS
jgi:hypothetical protein